MTTYEVKERLRAYRKACRRCGELEKQIARRRSDMRVLRAVRTDSLPGGSRNTIEAANLKRQGVRAGVPDLSLPVARGGYHGLYIEMKFGDNKPTKKQWEWIEALREQGYAVSICWSYEAARDEIVKYLKLDGERNE